MARKKIGKISTTTVLLTLAGIGVVGYFILKAYDNNLQVLAQGHEGSGAVSGTRPPCRQR